jgi:adenylate cyclase
MSDNNDPARKVSAHVERKLAAILSADVQGYSRLMDEDEEATLHTLQAHREVTDNLLHQHRGRIVGTAGDSVLAEFASVVDAVRCAVEIQQQLKVRNAELPEHRRMEFRIGINLGDVMVDGEQIYGDGVNVAARLQSLADAGGIFIAGTVYDQIENKLPLQYEYLGEQAVKNIAKPVRIYRVRIEIPSPLVGEDQGEGTSREAESSKFKVQGSKSKGESPKPRRVGITHRLWVVGGVGGLLLIIGTIVAVRYLSHPPLTTQDSALRTQAEPAPALPLPDKPSIVVLPFVNMSEDPKQDYFSDGITEDLTSDLSKISSLFVIARNSAFSYKGKAMKVQDVSKELGVQYVLEGSVRRADEQVRVTAQLIDATTGYHLWTERYDRALKDIFALQDEIVQKIATTLKLQLSLREQGYLVRKTTNDLEAYDYFLRGMESFVRLTKEANIQARQMLEKAIALDAQYALAYTVLGLTYWQEWNWRWSQDPQNLERAFELAQWAITLDDSLPQAHVLLSLVYLEKKEPDQAITEGERAIALDSNFANGYAMLAEALNRTGRSEDAIRSVEQAMRLNPRYPPNYLFELGWAYLGAGRYAEAIVTLKQVLLRNPNFLAAYPNLATSYVLQWAFQLSQDPQTLEQALAMAQRAVALSDSVSWVHTQLGYVYLFQKQYEQAISEMERAIALDPNFVWGYVGLANVLNSVGKPEEALGLVEKAIRLDPPSADLFSNSIGSTYYSAGRTEEAVAPLKRFLARRPNFLGAHLDLAAIYSELGQEAEARAEAAEVLRLSPNFSLEVHKQREPIKDPAVLERQLAALRKAGLK